MWFQALLEQREAFGPSHRGRSCVLLFSFLLPNASLFFERAARYKFVMLWLARLLQAGRVEELPEGVRNCLGVRCGSFLAHTWVLDVAACFFAFVLSNGL
jgi:hypothetical protein